MSAEPITDRNILITGGAGLIGSHIADLLVAEGARCVTVLDNFTRGRKENLAQALASGRVTVVEGDIRDRELLAAIMRDVDIVFHQAAIRITQCADEPRLAVDVLANGTFNVLEAAVACRVKKVVAASSASIYGLADHFPTTETGHPYDNRTLYGAAKLFNEGLLRSFHAMYGLNYVALRYFNVYGPRMDTHGAYTEVLIRWMERIAAGQAPAIFGNGLQTMDWVHVEDIARANILAAQSPVTDEVFNVASGTETSLNDLAKLLMTVMGADRAIDYQPERTVNPVPRRLASTVNARARLGFETRISLEDGLRGLVAWWSAQRSAEGKA
ncbi:MAG: SDR family NAD(P)-dependent oxidoreductase [Bryobacterales bacterium]|nr:SDR family NAD(P)-dependent oxidoreductase [Bryobacterales bacterium]